MGGVPDGMLRRLEVPMHFHGGEANRMWVKDMGQPILIGRMQLLRISMINWADLMTAQVKSLWSGDDPFTSMA